MDVYGRLEGCIDRQRQIRSMLLVESGGRFSEADAAFESSGILYLGEETTCTEDVVAPLFVEQSARDGLALDRDAETGQSAGYLVGQLREGLSPDRDGHVPREQPVQYACFRRDLQARAVDIVCADLVA